MANKLSSSEREWQIENDARIMKTYQEIMASPQRKNAALRQVKKEAKALDKTMKMASGKKLK